MNLPPTSTTRAARLLRRLSCAGGLALVAWLGAACQAQPAMAPEAAASSPRAPDALARIQAHIGQAPCSASSQCRTLAIGHRACGGPEQWLPWSTVNAQGAQLKAWSDELALQQKQDQQRRGLMSTCQVQPDPGAVCVNKRCVLGVAKLAE